MQPPPPTTWTSFFDAAFVASTAVQIVAVYLGVYFGQRFADRAQSRDRARENRENQDFVRSAIVTSMGHTLIAIWTHRRDIRTAGAPNSVGLLNSAQRIDPFRVTQALGRDGYDAFVAITGMVDLGNTYLGRLSGEHALAFFTQTPRPARPDLFARIFYAPYVGQMDAMLANAEVQITKLLAIMDPERLAQIEREARPRIEAGPTEAATTWAGSTSTADP